MTIASTIYHQLGGGRFTMMTGAYNMVDMGNALKMKLRKNKGRYQYLMITLMPDDTYTMTWAKIKNWEWVIMDEDEGIYFDMLNDVFESRTGQYTKL